MILTQAEKGMWKRAGKSPGITLPLSSTECGGGWWPWVVVAQWLEHWLHKPATWVRLLAASWFFSKFPFQPVLVSTPYYI